MSKYDDLVKKLKEIFQIDRPELDFGVYRILNARAIEINDYLENRLKAKVGESLAASGAANVEGLQKELKEKEAQYRADGLNPDTVPKVLEIREKLAEYGVGTSDHENAVFTHLLTFFSRYYDKGDFISQRRYKGDTYAIPYDGEEVVLHWANKDQYYTKSGENFSNYAFKLDDGQGGQRSVRFRLVTADTAKDNRKDNDKERRFVLIEPHTRILTDDEGDEYEEELLPVAEENGVNGQELVLRFEYKAMPKGSKQDALVLDAVEKVLADANVKARWLDLSKREPTEKNPQRTLLEKCLTNYTTKNTADYFIHKDLGGFLRRELDFYIKNEVMHLDDVQNAEKFADIEKNLRLIQPLRAIALDLITFLAQLEDFQKKLWLKKKFVVATHYCITLDRLPESLYPVIAANLLQWEQWEKLGMLDSSKVDLFKQAKAGSIEYLKAHPYLMADTALFDATFKQALLAAVDNLDEGLDGLLIHGDNFQALNLLQNRFRNHISCIYADPPYNAKYSEIIYKNNYKHSSWLTMFLDRFLLAVPLKEQVGALVTAIDENEFVNLAGAISDSLDGLDHNYISVIHNPAGVQGDNFSYSHEYAIFSYEKLKGVIGKTKREDESEEAFRDWGGTSSRALAKNCFYPIIVKDGKILGFGDVCDQDFHPHSSNVQVDDLFYIYPISEDGEERKWVFARNSVNDISHELVVKQRNGIFSISRIKTMTSYKTTWYGSKYYANIYGSKLLNNMFGGKRFDFPKSLYTAEDCLWAVQSFRNKNAICLDYFAGSGTTGHAAISLNRQDSGKRKYILVEQGEYFDTVLKPRIQKVVYSADWKDGKPFPSPQPSPQRGEGNQFNGISHAFKVLKMESYEDTLNNLQLRRTAQQQSLLDTLPQSAREDYLLRYLLDIESRGSLLSVEQFNKPFDCKLKVTIDSAGAYEERTIDLVETFNYLIGLRVKHIDMQRDKGFVSITGWLPTGEKTLVLWRDTEQVDYETLNRLCDKLAINPADSEFEIVYINGDHNIPAVFTSTEAEGNITKTLKIRQIEPEFLSRMFAADGE